MTVYISSADQGLAALNTEDFKTRGLISDADVPLIFTTETLLNQSADTPAYTVVGRITATGKVTTCDLGAEDGSQKPIGITASTVLNNNADNVVNLYRGGCFNPDALNWHASFDTAAKKRLAFEASQPTIFIKALPA